MALIHFPAAEGKRIPLPRRAHVAVDKGDVIANDDWPLRMALDHGVDEATATSHGGMPQETVHNLGLRSHLHAGICHKAHNVPPGPRRLLY